MRRVIGIDTHRTFGEVVIWEDGSLRHAGRIGMTRTALEGFGKNLLATDEVVIEATRNCMAVSRVLTAFVERVIIANPLQVKAETGKKLGVRPLASTRYRSAMSIRLVVQTAVAFESSVEMGSPEMEH